KRAQATSFTRAPSISAHRASARTSRSMPFSSDWPRNLTCNPASMPPNTAMAGPLTASALKSMRWKFRLRHFAMGTRGAARRRRCTTSIRTTWRTPMSALKIVATLVAKPGKRDELTALLTTMVQISRTEPGNLRFDLWRDKADENRFVLDELYTDQA